MSIAMLAASEPANNAVATRGAKKAAQDGDAPSSGFKDLIADQKGDKKADTDTGASGGEESQPVWRQFGFGIERGETDKNPQQAETDETTALLDQTDADTDTQSADALVDTTIIASTDTAAATTVPDASDMPVQSGAITEQIADGAGVAPTEPTEPTDIAIKAAGQVEQVAAGASTPVAAQATGLRPEFAQGKSPARGEAGNNAQNNAQAGLLQQPTANADVAGNGAEGGRQDQGRGNRDDSALEKIAQIAGSKPMANTSVIASQIAPAPVQTLPMSETGKAFATSLAAEVLPGDRADPTTQTSLTRNFGNAAPITTLKIQLHPAELGMVTARLSGTENQLSIAITVDSAEARHRLTADADAIIGALKGLGIDVDRVTIQQQQPGAGASPNGDGRGGAFSQSGESRGESQGQSSRQGSGSGNDEHLQKTASVAGADAAGSGVYI